MWPLVPLPHAVNRQSLVWLQVSEATRAKMCIKYLNKLVGEVSEATRDENMYALNV